MTGSAETPAPGRAAQSAPSNGPDTGPADTGPEDTATDDTATDDTATDDTATAAAVPPVAQERTDGPQDSAEFAARLDVDPERDGIKG